MESTYRREDINEIKKFHFVEEILSQKWLRDFAVICVAGTVDVRIACRGGYLLPFSELNS